MAVSSYLLHLRKFLCAPRKKKLPISTSVNCVGNKNELMLFFIFKLYNPKIKKKNDF